MISPYTSIEKQPIRRMLAFSAIFALAFGNRAAIAAEQDADARIPEPTAFEANAEAAAQRAVNGPFAEIEIVRQRYPDGRVHVEREVTLDTDGNYVNHGVWKMWDSAGNLSAEGQYNMGQRSGVWTRWHARDDAPALKEQPFNRFQTPFVSQATYSDGKLDGDWIIYDANQQKCSQITFQAGARHGHATVWLPGGEIYRQATYEHDQPVGDVMQRGRESEMKRVAAFVDGRRVVTKVTYFPNRRDKKTEALFLGPPMKVTAPDDFWNCRFAEYDSVGEDLRHGPWRSWYSNGQLQLEGGYRWDKEVGQFVWWHPNGQRAVQGEFIEGEQQGRWVWWHANGQKATQGEYNQGAQIGQWRKWGDSGQLDQQASYDGQGESYADVESTEDAEDALETAANKFPVLPWMGK